MKSNLDSSFKQDANLEKNGVWFELNNGIKFLVRRFGGSNAEVKKAMVKYYKPVAKLIEKGLLDSEREKEILARAFIHACIIDWEGVEIEGEIAPFSVDVAEKLFSSLPELLDTLMEYSQESENYREELGN